MNISFDFETLGKTSKAPIVQIGAVKFYNNGKIEDTFSANILVEDLDNYELEPDYSTVLWWLNQKSEVINQVFGDYAGNKTGLKEALQKFKEWIGEDGDYHFWSHATFDPPILTSNLLAVGIKPFIHYRAFKDIRTLQFLAGYPDVEKEYKYSHVALYDALNQMNLILKCFKIINKN